MEALRPVLRETAVHCAAALAALLAIGGASTARATEVAPFSLLLWLEQDRGDRVAEALAGRASVRGGATLDGGADLGAVEELVGPGGRHVGRGTTTLLMRAAETGAEAVTATFLEWRADPDMQDGRGRTALHRAAASGHPGTVGLLLAAGADPSAPDHAGNLPAHLASGPSAQEIRPLLAEAAAGRRPAVATLRRVELKEGRTELVYDLLAPGPTAVKVIASLDGGRNWDARIEALTGDVGPGVEPGTERQVVWDVGQDHEGGLAAFPDGACLLDVVADGETALRRRPPRTAAPFQRVISSDDRPAWLASRRERVLALEAQVVPERDFHMLQTPRNKVRTQLGPQFTAELACYAEELLDLLQGVLGAATSGQAPTELTVFRDRGEYLRHTSTANTDAGRFQFRYRAGQPPEFRILSHARSSRDRAFSGFDPGVINHEIVHQTLRLQTGRRPLSAFWNEGLASALSDVHFAAEGLRLARAGDRPTKNTLLLYTQLEDIGDLPPLEDLIAGRDVYRLDRGYRAAKGFIDFLLSSEAGRLYFRNLHRQLLGGTTLTDALGEDLADVERDWHDHLRSEASRVFPQECEAGSEAVDFSLSPEPPTGVIADAPDKVPLARVVLHNRGPAALAAWRVEAVDVATQETLAVRRGYMDEWHWAQIFETVPRPRQPPLVRLFPETRTGPANPTVEPGEAVALGFLLGRRPASLLGGRTVRIEVAAWSPAGAKSERSIEVAIPQTTQSRPRRRSGSWAASAGDDH